MPNRSEHLYQFHVKDQGAVGWNAGSGTAFAISQQIWYVEAVLGTLLHQLHALGPSRDDLVQPEVSRFSAPVAAVEDRTVQQTALIVAAHSVRSLGAAAATLRQHLVLQPASGLYYTRLPCILQGANLDSPIGFRAFCSRKTLPSAIAVSACSFSFFLK